MMSLVRAQFGEPLSSSEKDCFFYAPELVKGSKQRHPTEQSLFCRVFMINRKFVAKICFLSSDRTTVNFAFGECCTMSLVGLATQSLCRFAPASPVRGAKQNPLSQEGGFLFVLFNFHYSTFIIHFSQADFEWIMKNEAASLMNNE